MRDRMTCDSGARCNRAKLRTIAFAVLVVLALCATAAWAGNVYSENVGPGTLAVGGRGDNWNRLRVTGTSGVLTATSTSTTGNWWTLDASTLTTGNAVKIVGVDATVNAGKYLNLYGGTGTTSVWSVGEDGVTLAGVGATHPVTTAAGTTQIYGNIAHDTNALTGDLIGVRGNARCDVASTSGKAIGGYFLAGNTTAGFNMNEVRGVYCGTVTKTPTAADATWVNVKGIEIVTGNTATGATYKTDITNLYGIRLRIGSSTGSGSNVCGDITNGYGVWVDHEQQGQACRLLDAGFYLSATGISGGTKAWDYGIDMSGVGSQMGTADIRLCNGEKIDNLTDGTVKVTGALVGTTTIAGTGTITATGSGTGSIVISPIASGTGATTIQNQAGTPTITLPATTCTLPGLGLSNAFTAAQTITITGTTDASLMGIYSNVNQTSTATTNDLTAVRGNARIDIDSPSGKAIGGYFVAGNTSAGFNVSEVRGIYVGTMCKTPTAADKTHTNVKGVEIVTGNTAIGATYKTDVTNLYGVRLRIGSSTGSGGNVCGDITNGYGVWVDHEQQGAACRTLDAGFYLSETGISGANKAWDYGLDMNAVTSGFNKAGIRMANGVCIMTGAGSPSDGTTGDDFAAIGSMYCDYTNGNLYIQTAVISSPVWKLVTRAG